MKNQLNVLALYDAPWYIVLLGGLDFRTLNRWMSGHPKINHQYQYIGDFKNKKENFKNSLEWADVVILLGFGSESLYKNEDSFFSSYRESLAHYMDNGGGVIATGCHLTLGAHLSGKLPRISVMRKWFLKDNPPAPTPPSKALNTNPPQGSRFPQKLIVNQESEIARIFFNSQSHYILSPHQHEGECRLPLESEWEEKVDPEILSWSDTINGQRTLSIIAFDGEKKGRIVVHSTYHHFMNANETALGRYKGWFVNNRLTTEELKIIEQLWFREFCWVAKKEELLKGV